jgi:phosphoenolpyruvate---glycerone phosphotransferase subunit DhaL
VRKRSDPVAGAAHEPLPDRDGRSYTPPTVTAAPASSVTPSGRSAPARVVDAVAVRLALGRCQRIVERHAAYLTRLDAVLGDGDHGDNLVIGFRAVGALLAELPDDTPPGELLRAVGHRLVATVGGASGPLYGTAFLEAGAGIGEAPDLRPEELGPVLSAAAAGLARRGRCAVGDKTILDTLSPAADTFARELRDGRLPDVAYGEAVRAASRGMRSTRPLVARRGLAMRLGERAIGHLDPGAVSCLLLLIALGRD